MLTAKAKIGELRAFLDKVYNTSGKNEDIGELSDQEVLDLASQLSKVFLLQLRF